MTHFIRKSSAASTLLEVLGPRHIEVLALATPQVGGLVISGQSAFVGTTVHADLSSSEWLMLLSSDFMDVVLNRRGRGAAAVVDHAPGLVGSYRSQLEATV